MNNDEGYLIPKLMNISILRSLGCFINLWTKEELRYELLIKEYEHDEDEE